LRLLRLSGIWRRIGSSLTVKLIVLVGIFIALPVLLAGQFEGADRKMRELVSRGIERQNALTAEALKPLLDDPDRLPPDLSEKLAKFAGDNTYLKLMLRPSSGPSAGAFYFAAAAPAISKEQINAELDRLAREGVLDELLPSCAWNIPTQVRHVQSGSVHEILTSVIPINSRRGCWVLISSHSTSEFLGTSIGEPYWNEPDIRLAVAIYIAIAMLVLASAWSIWRNLRRFQRVAGALRSRQGRTQSFSEQNEIPELASVADVFDQLVLDLHGAARDIRRKAEDNAHSLKSPVATIRACLGPLRRSLGPGDERASRALTLIGSSVDRLTAMILAAQRLDNLSADLIEAPRGRFNLSLIVSGALVRYHEVANTRDIRQTIELDPEAEIVGSADAATVIVENILDNAISFSPPGGTIEVTVTRSARAVELRIMDEGPGIDPDKLDNIFERYFSLRPEASSEDGRDDHQARHAGLGLWIVRRHVEALNGTVTATNRAGGGTVITVTFPARGKGSYWLGSTS
jgi:two-component system, OmpR family, sensor histidine kinase ChvG